MKKTNPKLTEIGEMVKFKAVEYFPSMRRKIETSDILIGKIIRKTDKFLEIKVPKEELPYYVELQDVIS